MANNMSNGSSWSLAGESSIYSKDDDPPYKALYGVRKEKRQGIYQTEGMTCSVLVKIKDHGEVVCFVTWSGVTRDFNKPAQVNRFSSHFGKYSLQVDSNSTVATFGRFSFLPVGPIINSTSNAPSSKRNDSLVVLAFKAPEKEELTSDLEAYCFVGSEKLLLKLEFQEDTKLHKPVTFSGEDRQKLEWSSVLGAPIIVKNKRYKSSSNIGVWSVVGILGLSQEQELCPYFVTNEIFEQEASVHFPNGEIKSHDTSGQPEEKATGNPSGEQEVDAPGQPEEKATANPSGEQEVDAPAMRRKAGSPSEKELLDLAAELGTKWKNFLRSFGFSEAQIDGIIEENPKLIDKAYKALLLWKDTSGGKATYEALESGLCHRTVLAKNLAEEYCYDMIIKSNKRL
ncbi:uncharacterized protein [Montipora foliosa]|uniref:uncharacterized protein isoform X2 n=1 Tax=Montipora foliosa TaxID=591990 RepID=UPI0035F19314